MSTPPVSSFPLIDRLSEILATESTPAAVAPAPEASLSAGVAEDLRKTQQVLTVLTKQAVALNDRMNLLRAACEEARLMPHLGLPVHPGLLPHVAPIAAILRADMESAKLVASAVMRFGEIRLDIAELTEAMRRGESKPERLEAVKGKHAFMPRIHLYFARVPLVNALFAPPPPPPVPAPGPAVPAAAPQLTGRPSAATSANRPFGFGRRGSGPDQLALTSSQPPPRRPEAAMGAKGPVLLRALEVKMAILQAGWAAAQDPALDPPKLPAVLQPTVRGVSDALRADPALFSRATHLIGVFQRARTLVAATPGPERAPLAALLTELAGLPLQFRGVPALGPIFAAA